MPNCETKYCRNDAIEGRTICAKCRSRRYKATSPFRYHYNALRNNARRRGKEFDLPFAAFKRIWQQHPEKWEAKLADGECPWQMDRIDNTRGYVPGNIQIISKTRNIIKYLKNDRFNMDVYWKRSSRHRVSLNEAPF